MNYPKQYMQAPGGYETLTEKVPAPALRRSFLLESVPEQVPFIVSGLGYYRAWVNGTEITKGHLAPYTANPDDYLYFDEYDIAPELREGKNTLAFLLGNGLQNCFGGFVWHFDNAVFRGAPKVAFRLEAGDTVIESDGHLLTHPSPIVSNDYRLGEDYDARLELPGWLTPEYDDSDWTNAVPAPVSRGQMRLAEVEPIRVVKTLAPVSIHREDDAFIYDFGENLSGVCRLNVEGTEGQVITMFHGEWIDQFGKFYKENLHFGASQKNHDYPQYTQRVQFTCSGRKDTYTPSFTYMGFRYVRVEGIKPRQATPELLTFLVMQSDLPERGNFTTSDPTVAALQAMTRRSDTSNFFYFPTDCPHREKNGWTADAALSSEHILLNLGAERSYREWLTNIRAAMREDGALPGIIPTTGWGFKWGNGPAWDAVLTELPYNIWRFRGDTEVIRENAAAFLRYLQYVRTKTRPDGLIAIGLGDWCAPISPYQCPLEFTDSVMCYDIARKVAKMFRAIGMNEEAEYATKTSESYREAIRRNLIDFSTMTAVGRCQSSQAMAIFYGIFTPAESTEAFRVLLDIIREDREATMTGVLGVRVLFRVLADHGETDLAYRMLVRRDAPSYGNWVELGLTTLAENMHEKAKDGHKGIASLNHHFYGDISAWFIEYLAGIRFNPEATDLNRTDIRPVFPSAMNDASAFYEAPNGRITSAWKRTDNGKITLTVSVPDGTVGRIFLPGGARFEKGKAAYCMLASGTYPVILREKE